MRLETSAAVARVVGTRLTLSVDGGDTTLAVEEGVVALEARSAPEREARVAAGETASVHGGTLSTPCALSTAALWRERAQVEELVAPTADELAFRSIPWQTAISQARRLAAAAHAPILAWIGWGPPMGGCDVTTLDERRRILHDPRVLGLIGAHCIPLACDDWWLRRRGDADGPRLRAAMRALYPHTSIGTSLYLLDSELTPLACFHVEEPTDEVASQLAQALRAAHAPDLPSPAPWQAGTGVDAAPAPPAGSLLLSVASRRLARADGVLVAGAAASVVGLDRCWLAPAEWRALIPAGESATLPAGITQKLARQLCVDHTRDERGAWTAEALRSATIIARRARDAGGASLVELRGHFRLEDDPQRCEADLAGTLVLDGAIGAERITQVHLALLLQAGLGGTSPGGESAPLVGLSVGLDQGPDAAAVPPCGMRGLDYFDTP